MTRKEELEERVRKIVNALELVTPTQAAPYLLDELLQVEREVWSRVVNKIELEMEKENESTDDQIWEIRDWCKSQQQELT